MKRNQELNEVYNKVSMKKRRGESDGLCWFSFQKLVYRGLPASVQDLCEILRNWTGPDSSWLNKNGSSAALKTISTPQLKI